MKPFNNESEIVKYNLVNEGTIVVPNYDLSDKEVYFELYFSPDQTVCMIGKIDNNYLCWYSITKLSDKEVNEKIFNYVANHRFTHYSQDYLVLGYERFDEIRNWYRCEITRTTMEGISWNTPFGSNFGDSDKENHGHNFARNIVWFYHELLEKCHFRINEGFYTDILIHYLAILTKEIDYHKVKSLISILEGESFLRLSPNERVRELYLKCMKEGRNLYNRYMDRAR